MKTLEELRKEFEILMIKICADHGRWLKDSVVFRNGSYSPVDHKNEFHCQKASYFGVSFVVFVQQQKKIDSIVQLVYNETEDYTLDLKI